MRQPGPSHGGREVGAVADAIPDDAPGTGLRTWTAVVAEVTRRIADGEWRLGGIIPSEAELAAEFGCSRNTVNRALRALADQGILERKRRAGTRVRHLPESRARIGIPVVRHLVERRGARYGHHVLEQRAQEPPDAVAASLGLAAGAEALHVTSLHLSDAAPFALEDRWVSLAAVPTAATTDFSAVSVNEWLVRNVPFSTGEIGLSAGAATAEEAARLGCAAGTPVFVEDRVTRLGDSAITVVRTVFAPGYRMRLTI